jgi:hypothetical protein
VKPSAIRKESVAEIMRHYRKAHIALSMDALTLAEAHLQAASSIFNDLVVGQRTEMLMEYVYGDGGNSDSL